MFSDVCFLRMTTSHLLAFRRVQLQQASSTPLVSAAKSFISVLSSLRALQALAPPPPLPPPLVAVRGAYILPGESGDLSFGQIIRHPHQEIPHTGFLRTNVAYWCVDRKTFPG